MELGFETRFGLRRVRRGAECCRPYTLRAGANLHLLSGAAPDPFMVRDGGRRECHPVRSRARPRGRR